MARNVYLLKNVDEFAGFAHAVNTFVAGIALAHMHSVSLVYQPLRASHGMGNTWEDFFSADPRGLVPPIVAPMLAFNQTSLLVDGQSTRLVQLLPNADAKRIRATLSSVPSGSFVWLRKGRATLLDDEKGCDVHVEIRYAGLWLRERFWQAAHHVAKRARNSTISLLQPQARRAGKQRASPNAATAAAAAAAAASSNGNEPNITISIHIRRGDVTWLDRYGKPSHRFIETSAMLDVLSGVRDVIGRPLAAPAVSVHLHSEKGWLANDTEALQRLAPGATIHLDSTPAATVAALLRMASSDILLLGSSGFSMWAGFFSCGVKIGAADNGGSASVNLSLPVRHVFYPSSLTTRTRPFMDVAAAQFRQSWASYWACKQDAACAPMLCSAAHIDDPRWRTSGLAQQAIADVEGMQWRPPPPLHSVGVELLAAYESDSAALAASSPALLSLWQACLTAEAAGRAAHAGCLRHAWARNLSSFIGARKAVQAARQAPQPARHNLSSSLAGRG